MSYTIATIEDDLILARDLNNKLSALGYKMLGNATNAVDAMRLVTLERPDAIIADIQIEGGKDGIETVSDIYGIYKCPIIYLTANCDAVTVKRALATGPSAFLMKPYKISEFAINIDLAINRFNEQMSFEMANDRIDDSIFVPQNFVYYRIWKKDIIFAEADGAYVKVHTIDKCYEVTINLKSFTRQLNDISFLRISRKHLVNSRYVARIEGNSIIVHGGLQKVYSIAVGKEHRSDLLSRFSILRSRT